MRRILAVTHFLPWPIEKGSSQRICSLLEHLHAQGHSIDLFVALQRPVPASSVDSFPSIVNRLILSPPAGPEGRSARFIGHLGNLVGATRIAALERTARCSLDVARRVRKTLHRRITNNQLSHITGSPTNQNAAPGFTFTAKQKQHIRDILSRGEYDTVLVEYANIGSLFEQIRDDRRLWIVDTHDCLFERAATMGEHGFDVPSTHAVTREQEIEALQRFDVIVAIQEDEQRTFKTMLPDREVIGAKTAGRLQRLHGRPGHLALVGSQSPPNVVGAVRTLEQIWPTVTGRHPQAVLNLYGGLCAKSEVRHAAARFERSVVLHGVVDDMGEAYQADIVLAPLWTGSGLKTKVIEALCHGKPVVTTTVGAQGLDKAIDTAMLVADEPSAIAERLCELLDDRQRRDTLADAAWQFAQTHLGPDAAYAEIDHLLNKFDDIKIDMSKPLESTNCLPSVSHSDRRYKKAV